MAATQKVEIDRYAREVGIGDCRIYKVTLSGGATSFDIATTVNGTTVQGVADASWSVVYAISFSSAAASSTKDVYFDGTSVKGAGFTANDTVYVKVTGRHK